MVLSVNSLIALIQKALTSLFSSLSKICLVKRWRQLYFAPIWCIKRRNSKKSIMTKTCRRSSTGSMDIFMSSLLGDLNISASQVAIVQDNARKFEHQSRNGPLLSRRSSLPSYCSSSLFMIHENKPISSDMRVSSSSRKPTVCEKRRCWSTTTCPQSFAFIVFSVLGWDP